MPNPEGITRLRECRMAARMLLGPTHPATVALAEAIADPEALPAALVAIDELPALTRRRLLAVLAAVLP